METKRDRTVSTVISIFLHLLVVASLVIPLLFKDNKQDQSQPPLPTNFANLLSEKNSATEETEETEDVMDVDIVESVNESAGEDCTAEKSSYVGIGIVYNFPGPKIVQAPSQYPAAKAGIQIGDVLGKSTTKDGYMDVEINRNGEILKFHIKTQPICYQ